MELTELKSIWQTYDLRLEKSLHLNFRCIELIQVQKVRSNLQPLFWARVIEMVFHGLAIGLLIAFLVQNLSSINYAVSAMALLSFYVVAFVNCIKQLMLIKQVDYSDDIISLQHSLLTLRTHAINQTRLAVLFIPTFLAYPMVVSKVIADLKLKSLTFMDVATQYHGNWWHIQWTLSIILIPLSLWFYFTVSSKNIDKKWVKDTIRRFAGVRVTKAIEFVHELDSLKKDI